MSHYVMAICARRRAEDNPLQMDLPLDVSGGYVTSSLTMEDGLEMMLDVTGDYDVDSI